MEVILLGGGLYVIWDLALQRHAKLNSANNVFDDPTGVNRVSVTTAPIIYHEQQNKINLATNLSGKWESMYTTRAARARTSSKKAEMDRSMYHTEGYMPTSRVRLDSEPFTPTTHADFRDEGRGRLLTSLGGVVNEMLIRT